MKVASVFARHFDLPHDQVVPDLQVRQQLTKPFFYQSMPTVKSNECHDTLVGDA